VHAESDSSALTLESGDESVAPTPKGSVNTTGTDGATEYGDDEEVEVAASPGTRRCVWPYFSLTRLYSALCAASEGSWEGREGPRNARTGKRGRIYSRNEETEAGSVEPSIVGHS